MTHQTASSRHIGENRRHISFLHNVPPAWRAPVICLHLLLIGGCSQWEGANWFRRDANRAVANTPATTESTEPSAHSAPANTAPVDTHQTETVSQVLDFVDRLEQMPGDGSASGAQPAQRSTMGNAKAARSPAGHEAVAGSGGQETLAGNVAAQQPMSTANAPMDVAAPVANVPASNAASRHAQITPPAVDAVYIDHPTSTARFVSDKPRNARTPSANAPADATPQRREMTLGELMQALAKRLNDDPTDANAYWELALHRLALGEQDAVDQMSQGNAARARILGALTEVNLAARDAMQDPTLESGKAVAATRQLESELAGNAYLEAPNIALCQRVQSFGVYDELPEAALAPYQPNRVIVYVEVDNFASQKQPDNQYLTKIACTLEVLTADGRSLWRHEEPEIVDRSRRQRRDFFLAQVVTLPATLSPGDYVLKATLEDNLSGRASQALHPFAISAPLARSR